eukprot:m.75807 g.75807  ORF g.75807 m.75807 type:complete len:60 (+) comp16183_c0_seq3:166-345(+)
MRVHAMSQLTGAWSTYNEVPCGTLHIDRPGSMFDIQLNFSGGHGKEVLRLDQWRAVAAV